MTRTTTLALCTGVLIGFAGAQCLPRAHATSPQTQIKTEGDVIAFIVGGREVARIDASGLHVDGDVAYAGALVDYGAAGFNAHVKSSAAQP